MIALAVITWICEVKAGFAKNLRESCRHFMRSRALTWAALSLNGTLLSGAACSRRRNVVRLARYIGVRIGHTRKIESNKPCSR